MRTVIVLVVLALVGSIGAEARQRVVTLQWSELPAQISGKNVRAVLTDGVRLEGRAASVGSESLVIEVQKSSDPARRNHAASVRRADLAVLEVRKSGWKWKVIAPIVGFVSFGIAGAAIGNQIDHEGFVISYGAVNGAVAGMITGAGTGLVVGWLADRHYVKIEIIP